MLSYSGVTPFHLQLISIPTRCERPVCSMLRAGVAKLENEKRPPHTDLCRYGWEGMYRARAGLGQRKQQSGRRLPVPFQTLNKGGPAMCPRFSSLRVTREKTGMFTKCNDASRLFASTVALFSEACQREWLMKTSRFRLNR